MLNTSGNVSERSRAASWLFCLALPVLIGGFLVPRTGQAQDPQGPSLTATERSKLDGRFERVVQKAQDRELQSAIQKMEESARQARSQPRTPDGSQPAGGDAVGQLRRGEQTAVLSGGAGASLRNLPVDVRPDGRTADGTPVYGAIVEAESPSALQAPGATVTSTFDEFAAVRATPSGLQALAESDMVTKVRSPRVAEPHNDVGAAEVGARTLNSGAVNGTEYRGEGTMVCIIDTGIDWSHPDFTDEDGNTRIQAIWDQVDDSTSVNTPAGNDPSRFRQGFNPDYGSEYLRQDIQAALDGSGSVNQKDINGHGTHVAGTAGSSGEAYERSTGTERYEGAAPEADIIAVKAGNRTFSSINYINGIAYCQDVAEAAGKPVVVNMSLGGDFGPHDGSAPRAQAVSQLSARGGSAVITSAGNSGSPFSPIHTAAPLPAGDSVDVGIDVSEYTPNPGEQNDLYAATLWAYQPGPYEVSVYTPQEQDTLTVTIDGSQQVRDTSLATPRGTVLLASSVSGNGRYFRLAAFDAAEGAPPAEGQWTMRIRQNGENDTSVHGWFSGARLGSGDTAGSASFGDADNQFTIGIPATAKGVVAVGNYWHRARWTTSQGGSRGFSELPKGIIASSSSRGPTVDGRTKPDIAAPGTLTPSALSDDASAASTLIVGDGEHSLLAGTSMSAPLTAGSGALLMEEDPSLSTEDVRVLLRGTARTDPFVEARGVPSQTFGAGKLNAERALKGLMGEEEGPLEILAYNQPVPFGKTEPVTLGSGEAERAAFRFTPTQEGGVSGAYLSLGPNTQQGPANELNGPLRVEVWSDDGGVPGSQIGSGVTVEPSAFRGFTPTFVDLSGVGAPVEPEEDYHIVAHPEDGSGSVDLLAETAGPAAERSKTFDGSSWSGTGSDLVVRAQVSGNVDTETGGEDLAVWPGDTDNSGEVDQADVLPLGQYWGTTGPARDSETCQWQSYTAEPRSPEAATYADADGDGEVDQADVLCIGQNWGRSRDTSGEPALAEKQDSPQGSVRLRRTKTSGQEAWFELSVEGAGPVTGVSAALSIPSKSASVLKVEPGPAAGSNALFESNVDEEKGTVALGVTRKTETAPEGGVLGRVKMRFEENPGQSSAVTVQEATAGLKSGRLLPLRGGAAELPGKIALKTVSPNPVRLEAQVRYALPEAGEAQVVLYNALGQKVRTLAEGTRPAGRHQVQLETSQLASGLYFLRLRAGGTTETQKVTVVR